jgi:DNA-binding PadR family transcriptional regulator
MSVRHALLALLSEGPKYGLQLGQEFESRTGEVWPLNMGQVYTTLQRLERDGLVESDDALEDSPQKGFRITAAGSEELRDWLRTPPDTSVPPRDELVIKVLIAVRLPRVDVLDIVQRHRRHLVETMHDYTRLKEDASDNDVGLLLVADAEIFRLARTSRSSRPRSGPRRHALASSGSNLAEAGLGRRRTLREKHLLDIEDDKYERHYGYIAEQRCDGDPEVGIALVGLRVGR